jgi:lipopolysaccharide transport system permease protein
LASLFDFLVSAVILGGMMVYYHMSVNAAAFWVLPITLFLLLYVAAVCLVLSAVQVRFRDVGVAVPVFLQIWMFATPVVYPLHSVPAALRPWYVLNPMAGLVENFRRALIFGNSPEWPLFWYSGVASIAAFLVAYLIYKNVDHTFADVI